MESEASVSSVGLRSTVAGYMAVGAIVKAEGCATVSAEARTTVKAEDHSAVIAAMVVRAPVKAEEHAISANARTSVKAEDCSAVNASMVDRVFARAQGRATVGAEARTTAFAEDCSAVNASMVGGVTVKADECATVSAGAHTTIKAEGRSDANGNLDCGVIVKAEERAPVNAEARTTVKGGDRSAVNAGAYLSPSGALVHGLDSSRGEREEDARTLARIDPLQATMEFTSTHLEGLSGENQKVSDELRAIDAGLNEYRRFVMCTDDVCTAVARHLGEVQARKEEIRTRIEDAHDLRILARVHPPDEKREVDQRNRANRMATSVIVWHPRHAANEAIQMELDREIKTEGIAARTSDGLCLPEATQEEVVARRKYIHALGRMDPQERKTELSKWKRATKIATRKIHRHPRHAANEAKRTGVQRNSGGLDSAKPTQEEVRAQKEAARALAEMKAQQLARKVARMHRARRYALLAIRRQRTRTRVTYEVNASEEMEIDRKILMGDMNSGSFDVTEARLAEARRRRDLVRGLDEMDPNQRARGIARIRRASRAAAIAIQRQQRNTLAKEMGRESRARQSSQRTARIAAIAANSKWKKSDDSGDPDSAETCQVDPRATGVHAHAHPSGETDVTGARRVELQSDGTTPKDGIVSGEMELQTDRTALMNGVGAGEVEQQTDGAVFIDGIEADGVEQQTDGAVLMDGTGAGEVDQKVAVVDGIGANGFTFAKANTEEELLTKPFAKVAGEVSRDAAEVKKASLARASHAENLQTDEQVHMDVTGDGAVDRKATVVDATGVGGYPLVGLQLEELREKAVIGAAERVTRDAVGAGRKPDRARTHHSEKPRRSEDKKERKARRAARRIKKLRNRFIKAKRKGERLRSPVDIKERSVRLERGAVGGEGGGMQAPDTVQAEVQVEKTARGSQALARCHRGPIG